MAEKCPPGHIPCTLGSYVNFSSCFWVLSNCAKLPGAGKAGGNVSKSLQAFGHRYAGFGRRGKRYQHFHISCDEHCTSNWEFLVRLQRSYTLRRCVWIDRRIVMLPQGFERNSDVTTRTCCLQAPANVFQLGHPRGIEALRSWRSCPIRSRNLHTEDQFLYCMWLWLPLAWRLLQPLT